MLSSTYKNTYHKSTTESPPLPKGYAFNILLFLIFFLPVWDMATFKVGSMYTNVREVCLVLLPAVYFCYPRRNSTLSINTKYWILTFFALLLATELIKKVFYGLSAFDAVKNFRVTLPVLSGLLICLQGKKIDPRFCVKTILIAITVSYLMTPLMVVLGVQAPTFNVAGGQQMQVSYLVNGRFPNNNFEFSLLGIALLFYIPRIKTPHKTFKGFIIGASILSIVMLFLQFNRTVLAAAFLLGIIMMVTNLEARTLRYILATLVVAGSITIYFYATHPSIQRQVDKRIISVIEENNGLSQSVYEDNRDKLYDTYIDKLDNYWVLGLPGGVSLISNENKESAKSDISLYNIWIRHGLVALIAFIIVLGLIYADQRKKIEWLPERSLSRQITKAIIITFPLYFLISFNIDSLVTHNAILFLLLFINFYEFKE